MPFHVARHMDLCERRAVMARALNRCVEVFVEQAEKPLCDIASAGLEPAGEVMALDCVCVFRGSGDGLFELVCRWEGQASAGEKLCALLGEPGAARWRTALSAGEHINDTLSAMRGADAARAGAFGVKTLVARSVFSGGVFWGAVVFADLKEERCFDGESVAFLHTVARLCVSAVIRTERERDMAWQIERGAAELEARVRVLTEASPIPYVLFDPDMRPKDCNEMALKVFGCHDKQFFLEHFFERFSPREQPDGKRSLEKIKEMRDAAAAEGRKVFEWVHESLGGDTIPMEITLTKTTCNDENLFVAYEYDLRNIRMMEENIQWLKTEVDKIYYDALTGIYNRRFFDENLSRVLKFLSRSGGMLSMLMVDIDLFKRYNDTYGHSEGDKCLKMVAQTLVESITRADDFVARYGGEEFAVVLPNTDEKGARRIAEKLLENVRERNLPHAKNDAADCVTISIGAATGRVDYTNRPEDYIRRADEMLYSAKQGGRNRYSFALI